MLIIEYQLPIGNIRLFTVLVQLQVIQKGGIEISMVDPSGQITIIHFCQVLGSLGVNPGNYTHEINHKTGNRTLDNCIISGYNLLGIDITVVGLTCHWKENYDLRFRLINPIQFSRQATLRVTLKQSSLYVLYN